MGPDWAEQARYQRRKHVDFCGTRIGDPSATSGSADERVARSCTYSTDTVWRGLDQSVASLAIMRPMWGSSVFGSASLTSLGVHHRIPRNSRRSGVNT